MITPLNNKRFWFYNDWEPTPRAECKSLREWFRINFTGSDEYGYHTVVAPFGKGRVAVIVYRAGYKGFRKCEYCVESRCQTLEFEQDILYVQAYWNIEDLDDVIDMQDWQWDIALGVTR